MRGGDVEVAESRQVGREEVLPLLYADGQELPEKELLTVGRVASNEWCISSLSPY